MPERHPAYEYVQLFPDEEIPRILQNVQECCYALKRQSPCEEEKVLSKRIFDKLTKYPEYLNGPIVPHWESWLVSIKDGECSFPGRADILFSGSGMFTYFLIEAKRLYVPFPSGTDHLLDRYIKDGMMRFVEGKYAPMMIAGAMLGYVFESSVADAKVALAGEIGGKAVKLKLTVGGDLQPSAAIPRTSHSLKQGEFTIYHLLTKVDFP